MRDRPDWAKKYPYGEGCERVHCPGCRRLTHHDPTAYSRIRAERCGCAGEQAKLESARRYNHQPNIAPVDCVLAWGIICESCGRYWVPDWAAEIIERAEPDHPDLARAREALAL